MRWLVCIPAWGNRCIGTFERCALPATLAAIERADCEARVLVYTDDPVRIAAILRSRDDWRAEFVIRALPTNRAGHYQLGDCHRAAVAEAAKFDVLAFVNADMVPSIEVFAAAERRFAEGKRLVMMAGTRTIGADPPIGAASADLLRWSMRNAHPATRECVYGEGRSEMCSTIYFRRGDEVVMHAFHLHPFAMAVDREIEFDGVTIDCDLADRYGTDEIHVVADAAEAAFAEMSPPERVFDCGQIPMNINAILGWVVGSNAVGRRHEWFFEKTIAICGAGDDIGNRAIVAQVLKELRARPR